MIHATHDNVPFARKWHPVSLSPHREPGWPVSSTMHEQSQGVAFDHRSDSSAQLFVLTSTLCNTTHHPFHSLSVSKPLGKSHMNSQFASRAAFSICSRVASGYPNAIFEAIVPVNKTGSWGTTPIMLRHDVTEKSRISISVRLARLTGFYQHTLTIVCDPTISGIIITQQKRVYRGFATSTLASVHVLIRMFSTANRERTLMLHSLRHQFLG